MNLSNTVIPIRLRLFIGGHVQGVGYRMFAERKARELGVTGFVRNLDDGRVEVQVQGERGVVESFIDRLREGPSICYVSRVDRQEIEPLAQETDFYISG